MGVIHKFVVGLASVSLCALGTLGAWASTQPPSATRPQAPAADSIAKHVTAELNAKSKANWGFCYECVPELECPEPVDPNLPVMTPTGRTDSRCCGLRHEGGDEDGMYCNTNYAEYQCTEGGTKGAVITGKFHTSSCTNGPE